MNFKGLEISIKNVKTHMSTDGQALSCSVYVNNIRTFFYEHRGDGGEGYVLQTFNEEMLKKFNQAIEDAGERVIPANPKYGNPEFTCKWCIDAVIDMTYNEHERQKADAKILKLCKTALVWGVPGDNGYHYLNFKRPLEDVSKDELRKYALKYKAKFSFGVVFFNKNLKELLGEDF